MDPFQPEKEEDKVDLQHLLDGLHENFKEAVTSARGKRLDLNAKDLFEGQVWCVRAGAAGAQGAHILLRAASLLT